MQEMTTTVRGNRKFVRMDTKALVGAVFLGIVFVLEEIRRNLNQLIFWRNYNETGLAQFFRGF